MDIRKLGTDPGLAMASASRMAHLAASARRMREAMPMFLAAVKEDVDFGKIGIGQVVCIPNEAPIQILPFRKNKRLANIKARISHEAG